MSSRALSIALAMALACGDDDAGLDGGPDAAEDMAMDAGFSGPLPPMPPSPPDFGVCPEGWSPVSGNVDTCEPTPGDARCGPHEARFVGSDACARVGPACPEGDYAPVRAEERALYVHPDAAPDGDGSATSPFATIAAALTSATRGTVIALAKGRFDESVSLRAPVTIRGACAAETVISPAGSPSGGLFVAAGVTGAVFENLRVDVSDAVGVTVRGGASLSGVIIDGARLHGVSVVGGELDAEGLLVRGTQPDGAGDQGFGVVVAEEGRATLRRAVLEDNTQIGLAVGGGSTVSLEDVAVRSSRVGSVPGLAGGLVVEGGAMLVGARVELRDALGAALVVSGAGSAQIEDIVIRDVAGLGEQSGFGVSCLGGRVALTRAWIANTMGTAVAAASDAEVSLVDTFIDTVRTPPERAGWGVGVLCEGRVQARFERVWIRDTRAAGVASFGPPAAPPGAIRVEADDLTVRDVRDEGISGLGLYFEDGSDVQLHRASIERTAYAAIVAAGTARLIAEDVLVRDTQPAADGLWGRGLEVTGGATAEIERALFETQHEVAVIISRGATTFTELAIVGTRERGCAETTCASEPGGIGLGVYDGAEVRVDGFGFEGIPLCGVQIGRMGAVDLSRGFVRGASVGACVQVDGYDVGRLANDVRYEADTNIQTTSHYIPAVGDPLE